MRQKPPHQCNKPDITGETQENGIANLRQDALHLLKIMKQLESTKKKKMKTILVDRHTIISATPERLKFIKKNLKIK